MGKSTKGWNVFKFYLAEKFLVRLHDNSCIVVLYLIDVKMLKCYEFHDHVAGHTKKKSAGQVYNYFADF